MYRFKVHYKPSTPSSTSNYNPLIYSTPAPIIISTPKAITSAIPQYHSTYKGNHVSHSTTLRPIGPTAAEEAYRSMEKAKAQIIYQVTTLNPISHNTITPTPFPLEGDYYDSYKPYSDHNVKIKDSQVYKPIKTTPNPLNTYQTIREEDYKEYKLNEQQYNEENQPENYKPIKQAYVAEIHPAEEYQPIKHEYSEDPAEYRPSKAQFQAEIHKAAKEYQPTKSQYHEHAAPPTDHALNAIHAIQATSHHTNDQNEQSYVNTPSEVEELYPNPRPLPNLGDSSLPEILQKLQDSNHLPKTLSPENIDNSIKTLVKILNNLKQSQSVYKEPEQSHLSEDYDNGDYHGGDDEESNLTTGSLEPIVNGPNSGKY